MAPSAPAAPSESDSSSNPSSAVQLFVRNLDSRTAVIRARPEETVEEVLGRLDEAVGRRGDLRLVYAGRDLPPKETIGALRLPSEATLHINSRLRSTPLPGAWYLASQIIAAATHSTATAAISPEQLVRTFLENASTLRRTENASTLHRPRNANTFNRSVAEHLDVFLRSGAAGELVRLYLSKSASDRDTAKGAIECFLQPNAVLQVWTAPVLMEFCRLIGLGAGRSDQLYTACRGMLATVLSTPHWLPPPSPDQPRDWVMEQVVPFAQEMADAVMNRIDAQSWRATATVEATRNLIEFYNFFSVLRREVRALRAASPPCAPTGATQQSRWKTAPPETIIETIISLLTRVEKCMERFEMTLPRSSRRKRKRAAPSAEQPHTDWVNSVWTVLTELDAWSWMHKDVALALRAKLAVRKASLDALVLRVGRDRSQGIHWIAKHKDLLTFEARRHLAMTMLPELKRGAAALPLHEMLIDRSRLLSDSFEYITQATREQLHATQFVEFKDEEATGPGVMREWLCMVCHALFNPQHVLFSPCPRDRRRFFLNPSSVVDPLHLKYYGFAGRIIGLALMHKIQVGIFFDRTLFLQLAGIPITLDDIADADPCMHEKFRQILEMDPDLVDSDALGLTFAREVEVLASRKLMELIPGGKDIAVDSKNRRNYIDLLIQDRFVNSTKNQLIHFTAGFTCMLVSSQRRGVVSSQFYRAFFKSLDPEDFDQMLGGSNSTIDVKDWRAHTEYSGYREKDDQINWFWKAVKSMTVEQQRRLLFFWTSVKYLPFDGFGGLSSRLFISRALSESPDHLPSSRTCFYRLNLPDYTSFSMMQSRLQMIVQEHVSSSFGAF